MWATFCNKNSQSLKGRNFAQSGHHGVNIRAIKMRFLQIVVVNFD
jgi:hypothetical protein